VDFPMILSADDSFFPWLTTSIRVLAGNRTRFRTCRGPVERPAEEKDLRIAFAVVPLDYRNDSSMQAGLLIGEYMKRAISIEGKEGAWTVKSYHREQPDKFPTLTAGPNGWTEREPYGWFPSPKEAQDWYDANKHLLPED
jgi:hypothetical protein